MKRYKDATALRHALKTRLKQKADSTEAGKGMAAPAVEVEGVKCDIRPLAGRIVE